MSRPDSVIVNGIVRQALALQSGNRKVVRLLSPNAFSYGSPDGRQLNLQAMRDLLGALRKAVTARARISFAHFPSEARPEHITPETLDLLNEFADNDEIVIGAQSGSRRMLEACHRSHTVDSVLAAVALARKQPIMQGNIDIADMQPARGAGCEANANRHQNTRFPSI